jgi:proteasome lid subunit RPN8/RPN11
LTAAYEVLRCARSCDGDRPARVVYHSHTNGRAYFSTVDRQMAAGPAYPVQHVVIGVAAGAVSEAAQFAWSASAGDYVEIARWAVDERSEKMGGGTGSGGGSPQGGENAPPGNKALA